MLSIACGYVVYPHEVILMMECWNMLYSRRDGGHNGVGFVKISDTFMTVDGFLFWYKIICVCWDWVGS